jgi:hypothetical protein
MRTSSKIGRSPDIVETSIANMSFDPGSILLELLVSGVGFVLFTYGRKQQRVPHLVAGLLFMVYPIFVSSFSALVIVGVLLGGGLWWAVRLGW